MVSGETLLITIKRILGYVSQKTIRHTLHISIDMTLVYVLDDSCLYLLGNLLGVYHKKWNTKKTQYIFQLIRPSSGVPGTLHIYFAQSRNRQENTDLYNLSQHSRDYS